jgi:acetaldehyde dehydrogenase (acetylating)
MIKEVQKYVPGYRLVNGPVFDGKRVSVFSKSKASAISCRSTPATSTS